MDYKRERKMALKRTSPKKIKQTNSLLWLFESLEERIDFNQKAMFGCQACYLGDKLALVLADSEEPWNGRKVGEDPGLTR